MREQRVSKREDVREQEPCNEQHCDSSREECGKADKGRNLAVCLSVCLSVLSVSVSACQDS